METVTRNTSRKSKKSKPVVDVPKNSGDESRIAAFIDKNKDVVTKFMKDAFEEVGQKEINEVLRECAECSVLTRSPKKGGCWEDDTQIIEDALKVCQTVKLAAVPDDDLEDEEPEEEEVEEVEDDEDEKSEEEPEDEEESDDEIEDIEDLDDGEEPVEEDVEEQEDDVQADEEPVVASQPEPRKKATKEAKSKSGTKTTKAKASKTKPAKEDKKAKPSKKAQPKTAQTKAMMSHEILTTTRFSEDSLKDLKGKDLWFGTARLLKIQGKARIQIQDIPEVVGHLYEVHTGKAKLSEEGFDGKGEKSYKKRRLLNILGAIKAHLGLT